MRNVTSYVPDEQTVFGMPVGFGICSAQSFNKIFRPDTSISSYRRDGYRASFPSDKK
jgi:hypothetical protein